MMSIFHHKFPFCSFFVGIILIFGTQPTYPSVLKEYGKVEQKKETSKEQDNRNNSSKNYSTPKAPVQTVWDQIKKLFRRIPRPLVTRSTICPIAPGILETENKIFNLNPVFIWSGKADQIVLKNYDDSSKIWSKKIPVGIQFYKLEDIELFPGNIYIWELRHQNLTMSRKIVEVMSPKTRNSLKNDQAIFGKKFDGISNLEEASYFSRHQLWSDTLSSLLQNVDKETYPITSFIQTWSRESCNN